MKASKKFLVGDFETTVYKEQKDTLVWASGLCELNTEMPKLFGCIEDTFTYLSNLKCDSVVYYHNLKFDGSFYLDYLIRVKNFKLAMFEDTWVKDSEMQNNTLKCLISDMGQWYTITIKVNGVIIELRDSLKILPFTLRKIGKDFETIHQKLNMDYAGYRYPNCPITKEEKAYILNDVLVLKEAIEKFFQLASKKLTIGSCCMEEFKRIYIRENYLKYDLTFPDLYAETKFRFLDSGNKIVEEEPINGYTNVGEYIRKSYKGAWCYLKKGCENKIYEQGVTADVNSLYPSEMHSDSGNIYPIGHPTFWSGNYIPQNALDKDTYYFIRIKTRFYLKENYLPFIQIKHTLRYKANEMLETSDVYDNETQKYYSKVLVNGEIQDTRVEMTLTMTDFILIKEHYELVDFEILDGCYFRGELGLFDTYINKYKKIKMESKGALRTLAKLFLNNLYGKMATSIKSSFKYPIIKDNVISFKTVIEYNKKGGYIPIGSAITSYARNFTIRHAQKNYDNFIYADTDSLHCCCNENELIDIEIDDNDFEKWKIESSWDNAIFVRQKTYIERIVKENLEEVEPHYNITCAGMPQKCKNLLNESITQNYSKENRTKEELDFIKKKRDIADFKKGLIVPCKLMPKRIKGGTLLVDTTYEMR